MGSIDAMKEGSSDRYFQQKSKKLVPEGIVGRVPFRGLASETIYQLVGGVRSGMGYCGAATIQELFEKSQMVEISAAGLREATSMTSSSPRKPPTIAWTTRKPPFGGEAPPRRLPGHHGILIDTDRL